MTTAHRFVSLSLLGGMALALAPLVSAQGFGGGMGFHGRGHMNFGGTELDADTRAEIHTELKACKDDNAGDQEAMKACVEAIAQKYDLEMPMMHENMPEIPEEARAELKACHEDNAEDPEAMRTCADAVFTKYGIEKPDHGVKMGHRFRSAIEDACGQREDTDAWRTCAQEQRSTIREDHPRAFGRHGGLFGSSDLRADLQACLDNNTDATQLRACVFGGASN